MSAWLWSLVGLPAVAGALLAPAGRDRDGDSALGRAAGPLAVAVAAATLGLAVAVAVTRPTATAPFLAGGPLALGVDGLAAVVAVTVAAVALLVLAVAAAQVRGGRPRFFGLLLLFLAAVLLTVTATTLTGLLLAWELMGAASYALIAFDWRRSAAVSAGATAFLTTRATDLGLYLAVGAALAGGAAAGPETGSAAGPGADPGVGPATALTALPLLPGGWLDLAAAGVLVAALGKAAQLPLSFWLSGAMLGPSPVSALLHSAAMVAMGGYLLLRTQPLLLAAGWAADAAAWVGAATAVLLGVVAVAARDLKQLLAASTAAQLGFVVLAAGTAGGAAGGAAHLVGHAAVKSLLFLAAGVWAGALGTARLDRLRGAARQRPGVGAAFTVGALALAGVPPLSLWATKDALLAAVDGTPLRLTALAGAALAAVYAGRAAGLLLSRPAEAAGRAGGAGGAGRGVAPPGAPLRGGAGWSAGPGGPAGPEGPDSTAGAGGAGATGAPGRAHGTGAGGRPSGSPRSSWPERVAVGLPLGLLAAASALLGVLAVPAVAAGVRRALGVAPDAPEPSLALLVGTGLLAAGGFAAGARLAAGAGSAVGAGSAAGARLASARRAPALPEPGWARSWLRLEAAAHAVAVRPVLRLAGRLARWDAAVLDRATHRAAAGVRGAARATAAADARGPEAAVRGLARGARRLGRLARRPQTGQLHDYYAQLVAALAAAVALLTLSLLR